MVQFIQKNKKRKKEEKRKTKETVTLTKHTSSPTDCPDLLFRTHRGEGWMGRARKPLCFGLAKKRFLPRSQDDSPVPHRLPAHIPTNSLDKMIISNDLATSLLPIKIAGTMEKTLFTSKAPFLQSTKHHLVWSKDSLTRPANGHCESTR